MTAIRVHQRARFALATLAAALLASCTVGPDYKRPPQEMPGSFKGATSQPTSAPTSAPASALGAQWWHVFSDEHLDNLEEAAVAANPGIVAAMARVEQARAAARITGSEFYPVITLDPSWERGRTPINPTVNNPRTSVTQTNVRIPFDVSYELDIWGRIRRAYEAARAQYQATADDYQVVLLTLQADVAQNYFSLRSLDAQDKILLSTVDSYQKQLDLTTTQLRAGLVGPTDEAQARSLLNSTSALEVDVRRQRADTEHALAILLGRPPSDLDIPNHPLDATPPTVPVGLPAELLRRRPDVTEAEESLIAASAQIGVAKAQFYPSVSLTGAAGFESFDVQHALDWENRIWSLGAGISAPIFEGGRLRANLDQATARYAELAANYRSTVLGAIRDVEDSLTDLHLRADQAEAQNLAVDASREYYRLSELQYRQGLISYLQVIDAERTLLSNELTAQQTLNQRMTSTVLLIKAMGGGWEGRPTTMPAPAP